jgi:signal transduction histidine kinase
MDTPERHTPEEMVTVCPVTGLTVISRPEWNVNIPDQGYEAVVSIIGNQIIKTDVHGYSTRQESRKTAQVFDSIIPEYLDWDRGVVQIFNLEGSTGFSLASRRNYLRAIKRRKGLLGIIYYNTSQMLNISLRIGRKLNWLSFGAHIVNNYEEALTLATKLTSTQIPATSRFQVDTIHKPFTDFEASEYCPVTGLPVISRPEWTDIPMGKGYSTTFKVIGKHILMSRPEGRGDEEGNQRFYRIRSRVIQEAFGNNGVFFEIKDYRTACTPSRIMRKLFVDQIEQDAERMVGFVAYNTPKGVRFAIKVGERLIPTKRPTVIAPDYQKAMGMALSAMEFYQTTNRFPPVDFFRKKAATNHMPLTPYHADHFVDELLHYLGNINWEIDGLDSSMTQIPSSHPFSLVYKAIALVKSDLDHVTRERRLALKELRKSENRYRVMAENALKSSEALKKAQEHLIQTEKMAALGSLVAGVSHEISTPLGISVTAASFLRQKTAALEMKKNSPDLTGKDLDTYLHQAMESVTMIDKNLNRASELINSFKQISVDQSNEIKRSFNLKDYIEDILQSLNPKLKQTSHSVVLNCPEDITVESYPGALSQILTNLVMNSLIHGFQGMDHGEIGISVTEHRESLVLDYRDNGRGMDEQTLKHIYDPFYTTCRASGGTGLGMNIVFTIVTGKLNGTIQCTSTPGQGARFLIQLPH